MFYAPTLLRGLAELCRVGRVRRSRSVRCPLGTSQTLARSPLRKVGTPSAARADTTASGIAASAAAMSSFDVWAAGQARENASSATPRPRRKCVILPLPWNKLLRHLSNANGQENRTLSLCGLNRPALRRTLRNRWNGCDADIGDSSREEVSPLRNRLLAHGRLAH
jgi:hypothetical protein